MSSLVTAHSPAERDVLIGVDVGGTFTDAVRTLGPESFRAKSPTTYPDTGRGVLASCRLAAQEKRWASASSKQGVPA